MSPQREKAYWFGLVLVLALTVSQAYLARAAAQAQAEADPFQSLLGQAGDPFGTFFKDGDPFSQMRDLQRRLLPLMEAPFAAPGFAFPQGELRTGVSESGGKVVVSIQTPREKGASVRVTVKDGMIRARSQVRDGGSSREEERLLSVPPDADPATARIEKTADGLRVVFARRSGKRRLQAPSTEAALPADALPSGPSA